MLMLHSAVRNESPRLTDTKELSEICCNCRKPPNPPNLPLDIDGVSVWYNDVLVRTHKHNWESVQRPAAFLTTSLVCFCLCVSHLLLFLARTSLTLSHPLPRFRLASSLWLGIVGKQVCDCSRHHTFPLLRFRSRSTCRSGATHKLAGDYFLSVWERVVQRERQTYAPHFITMVTINGQLMLYFPNLLCCCEIPNFIKNLRLLD